MHPGNSVEVIDRCSKSGKHLSQLRKLAGNVLPRLAASGPSPTRRKRLCLVVSTPRLLAMAAVISVRPDWWQLPG
jgi:hypothetical protein